MTVCGQVTARVLGMPGERDVQNFTKILADALEALVASVYLDGGFEACRRRVLPWFEQAIDARSSMGVVGNLNDYVKFLQAEAEKAVNEAQAPPEMEAEPDELDIMLKVEQVRKAKADADKTEWDAKRASVGLLDDMHNHNMRPVEAAMAERDLEDRLNPQAEAIEPV
jgi:dsRNA-specific ribonuclease